MKKSFTTLSMLSLLCFFAHAQNDPGLVTGDTGSVRFVYRGNQVTYTTVRAADGHIWLQQNLGATRRATSATDASAYGDLFQWGRWDDGHQLRNSATSPVTTITPRNPAGIPNGSAYFLTGNNPNDWWGAGSGSDTWSNAAPSDTNGTDPCSALGARWRLPTQQEFANVIMLENITDMASAFSSHLMLTAAGSREGIFGNIINAGSYGNYWTSTPNTVYAKDVTIGSTFVNSADDAYRSYAMSVRCLTTCTGVSVPRSIMGPDSACPGTLHTFSVPPVNNADHYIWTVPAGWSIVGPDNEDAVNVIVTDKGTVSVRAVNNCDSSTDITKDITVFELNPVITTSGFVLSTMVPYATYQWMRNETAIPGATGSTYTVTENGSYRVAVSSEDDCMDTSAAYDVNNVAINRMPEAGQVSLYPNPAQDRIYISSPVPVDAVVIAPDGRVMKSVRNAYSISLEDLTAGMYLVRVTDQNGRFIKIEKLVKK